jgi:DNA polymerase-3 subunit gamma/tau
VAVLGRRDLPLAPDEYAGFTMTLLRMLSFGAAERGATADVKPVSAPKPVAAPAKPAAPSTAGFDGNWPALVERMNLTGMARMAAQHAEFGSFENNHLELVVPEAQRMYAEKPYLEKLKAELVPHLGANLRLSMRVGTTSGTSLAATRSKEMAQKQASAAEAIEDDPFVRDLVRDLGAEVVPSSIRPLDEPAGKPTNGKR